MDTALQAEFTSPATVCESRSCTCKVKCIIKIVFKLYKGKKMLSRMPDLYLRPLWINNLGFPSDRRG